MNRKQVFPSKYLSAEDLGQEGIMTVQVCGSEMKKVQGRNGESEDKFCLKLLNVEKMLVLNATNWDIIQSMLNEEESDNWTRSILTLQRQKTRLFGEMVDCIRIIKAEWPKKTATGDDIPF